MTDNAEAFYCPICERVGWNRESHVHDQDVRRPAELTEPDEGPATAAELALAILDIDAADRTDPRKVAATLLAQFDVSHRTPAAHR